MSRSTSWSRLKILRVEYLNLFGVEYPYDIRYFISTISILEEHIKRITSLIDRKKEDDKKDMLIDDCSICTEKLYDFMTLDCSHKFHARCIRELFFIYMQDRCPICRSNYVYKFPINRSARKKHKKHIKKMFFDHNMQHEIAYMGDSHDDKKPIPEYRQYIPCKILIDLLMFFDRIKYYNNLYFIDQLGLLLEHVCIIKNIDFDFMFKEGLFLFEDSRIGIELPYALGKRHITYFSGPYILSLLPDPEY